METVTSQPAGSTEPRRKMLISLLTESDFADIDALVGTGLMPRRNAQVLVTLQRYGEGNIITSRWIERIGDLRQPEVSLALKDLISAGIVSMSTHPKQKGKGRPVKVYRIIKPLHKYVKDLAAARQAELNKGVSTMNAVFGKVPA